MVLNVAVGYIISVYEERRYLNSLLRENTMQTRQSYYVSQDMPALHLPVTNSLWLRKGKHSNSPWPLLLKKRMLQ